jgi:hypothetical protein
MKIKVAMIAAVFALAASAGASAAETDKAFTATGTDCTQIVWSQEQLAKHPKIGSACKEVVQRNGKTYVKFEGEVRKVADKGQTLVVEVANGDMLTVNPPPDFTISIGGKPTPVKTLRPGDMLTFYVPEDRLTAQFDVDDAMTAQVAPIVDNPPPQQMAYNTQTYDMPRTASMFPTLALLGGILILLATTITARRWMHRL